MVAALRDRLGLDAPIGAPFVTDLGRILHGGFGRSVISRRPIADDILTCVPATLELVAFAAILSLFGGMALGTIAAASARWVALAYTVINFAVDLSYALFEPRVNLR